MFHPNKNVQIGGDYTNTTSILNSDIYGLLSGDNRRHLQSAIDTPTKISTLRSEYTSTISSIGLTISSLEAEFSTQKQLSTSSIIAKNAAYNIYKGSADSLSTFSSLYMYSSILCSSYVSTLRYVSSYVSTSTAMLINLSTCTYLSTCQTVQSGGDATEPLSYDYIVALSTMHGSTINQQISTIYNLNIPSVLSTLSTYSTQYISALIAYDKANIPIGQIISANAVIASTNSTLNASIAILTARIASTNTEYLTAKGIIAADDAVITYLSTLQLDAQAYTIYNSTVTTMQTIENLYNLVMNGISVPTEIISAIPVQGGGGVFTPIYQPLYIVSSFTCSPSDTVCNEKLSRLNKYITAYFSLSTALPIYSQNYDIAHQARLTAEANTPLRLSTILQDTLKEFDDQFSGAEQDIQINGPLLQQEQAALLTLYGLSTASTISISSNLFTDNEIADLMSYGGVAMSGGTSIGTQPNILVKKALYSESAINTFYSSQVSTYNLQVISDQVNLATLQAEYISSIVSYQIKSQDIMKKGIVREQIVRDIVVAQTDLDSNTKMLSSLQTEISTISTAIINNNPNNIIGSGKVISSINSRLILLTAFEISTLELNNRLSTYYNNEMNLYINTLSQISSYILYDATLQQYSSIVTPSELTSSPTIENNISQLSTFLSTTQSYISYISNEQYLKNLYLYTKGIYEIEEGNIANGTDPANLLTSDDLDRVRANYDIYVSEINNMIATRRSFNSFYLSSISTIYQYIAPETQASMYGPFVYNTSTITLLPYTMRFEFISTRTSIFNKGDMLPESVIPICPPTTFIDGTPQTTTTIPTPTTTLNTTVYGVQGRYVQITRADNNFEILQVIVVDSKGKNAAFQKPVLVSPLTFNASGRAQYITNGTYSASSNFMPPVGISGSGTYIPSIDSNSALGSITCDPITGIIYLFNLHTMYIQTVSPDLKTVTNYANCANSSYSCISAYNGIVYGVDWMTKTFYSVNSSGVKTVIQDGFTINGPSAISNVYNNTIYITNNTNVNSIKTILSYNIINNTQALIASTGAIWGASIDISNVSSLGAIAIGSDGIIYVVDNGYRILSLNTATNAVRVVAGTTVTGYTDGLGENARFNGINSMTIDSQNNLFVTDANNITDANNLTDTGRKIIRKIDTLTGNVTTYTRGLNSNGSAVYTTGSTILANIIATPVDTTPRYMSYLYSICIAGGKIYTTSYDDSEPNNWYSLWPNQKNATPNTWITCYPYTSYGGAPASANYFASTGQPVVLTIDLGVNTDITAIRYIKKNSSYSSSGLTFRILDSNNALVGTPKQINVDLGTTNFDLRATNSIDVPLALVPNRTGVCGPLGRYVKLSNSGAYYYALTQISVITADGTNVALGASIYATMGGTNVSANALRLINGTYNSLPESSSFVYASTSASDYIIIDLGTERDISAINLYYSRGSNETIQNTATVSILSADMQVSLTRPTSQYHTTMLKEIIDFRSNLSCPISVKWAPFYGTAGVIARYIRVSRPGQIAFSKLQVVDRTGLDVAQFLTPTVNSGALTAPNALTNVAIIRLKSQGYLSDSSSDEYFSVDLTKDCEICAINLYGCIDIDLMSGLKISLYSSDPSGSGVSPLITYNAIPGLQIQQFDMRYEPDTSNYPTSVSRSVSKYGPFGVYAQTISIYTTVIPSGALIVDAIGASLVYTTPTTTTLPNARYKTTYTLSRMYEITSVLIQLPPSLQFQAQNYGNWINQHFGPMGNWGTTNAQRIARQAQYDAEMAAARATFEYNNPPRNATVQLYDCYNILVGSILTTTTISYPSTTGLNWYAADFRNYLNNVPNPYAPIIPWTVKRGGYRLDSNGSLSASTPYTTSGVKARYVKIIPRDPTTPLYISQILAVDEFGINRAFEKQTFHMKNSGDSANLNFPLDGKNAVDGVYEAQIDHPEFLTLFFTKYKRKPTTTSYVSYIDPVGTAMPTTYAFFIDLELDQTTDPSMMDPTKGKEYSINSIIYVAASDKGTESEGVIIQLLDDNLNVVGSQAVTRMAKVFGVDILDFRADVTIPMNSIPNRVEVRERIIEPGPEGCGVKTQYIRVEQLNSSYPIQLSYVVVTDTTGYNVAMFKPTYSSSNNMSSFMIVDGNYYLKNPASAFTTTPSANEYQYIEINLGKEYELMNLLVGDVFGSSAGFSTLRVRLYNKDRDIIGSQSKLVPATIKSALGATTSGSGTIANTRLDTNNFMFLSKVGVSIANNLVAYKYNSGLTAAASVTTFSTINTTPSLLSPLGNTCNNQIITTQRYTRVNGGIPSRYVRVYNVGQYIQVSQLMVYDTTGANVAYKAAAYATSILPNNYAAYATDGYGGFFHRPRSELNCFISGNRPYDYLEIDLGATYNIIAARYIPPSTNSARNIGVRVQLLDALRTTLTERIVTTQGDTILDYRLYNANNPSIYQLISHKIYTASNLYIDNTTGIRDAYITGFCVKQDRFGIPPTNVKSFYYAHETDLRGISNINSNTYLLVTSDTAYYGPWPPPANSRLMGLYYSVSEDTIYMTDYSSNKIIKVVNSIDSSNGTNRGTSTILISSGLTNPYSLVKIGNLLYISENRVNGNIYSYDGTTLSASIYTADYIGCITADWDNNLLACVGSTKQVIRITLSSNTVTLVAGPTGSSAPCIIPLEFPSGIAVDNANQIIFVSDIITNKIYAISPNNKFIVIAGTGVPGYSGDNAQGLYAAINGPFFLQYYPTDGCLYFADKNNNCIRKIDLQLSAPANVQTTITNPPAFTTTTIPSGSATGAITEQTAIITRPRTNDTYVETFNTPTVTKIVRESQIQESQIQYCFSIPGSKIFSNTIMYYASGNIYDLSLINNSPTLAYTYNIDITSIAYKITDNTYLDYVYFGSMSTYKIYVLNGGFNATPSPYCGNGTAGYSPDGTSALVANIIPYATTYNTTTNSLYFTDCQPVCGLVRNLSPSNTLQTLVGLYTSNALNIDPTSYYNFTQDLIRPETNPLAIYLLNPTAIITDNNGYTYIADSGTHCIHRLTPYGALQPVCGPFRTTQTPIDFLNNYAIDIAYDAYSVKINTPNSLTFDSNMNLICTSLNGCQIVSISNLDSIEPTVQVICGLGVNVNNLPIYATTTTPQTAKYLNPRYPKSICYAYTTNSLYYIDNNGATICKITLPYNSILYKGNNGILPYGTVTSITNSITNANYCTIDNNENIYYSDINTNKIMKYSNTGIITEILSESNSLSDLCVYNDIYIYYISSGNNKIHKYNLLNNTNSDFITDTNTPRYIVLHDNGYMFVSYTNMIKVIYVKDNTPLFSTLLNGINYGPIAIDNITNNLYVTSYIGGNNTIEQYPISFSFNPSPSQTISAGITSTTIQNLICDTAGNIYISDATKIYQLLASNNYNSVNSFVEGFSNPKSMCFYNNKIYVADTGNNRICYINTTSGSITSYSERIVPTTIGLSLPRGIFVNSSKIYIADTGNNRICIQNNSDAVTALIIITGAVLPLGIAVDSNNTIYYTSLNTNLYSTSATTGSQQPIHTVLTTDNLNLGQLSIDSNNILYTNINGKIIRYTTSGKLIGNIPQNNLVGVYKYNNTYYYVTSSTLNSVYNQNGVTLTSTPFKSWTYKSSSNIISIDGYNNSIYCMLSNKIIYKLTSDNLIQYSSLYPNSTFPASIISMNLNNPSKLRVAKNGSIYIMNGSQINKINNRQKIDTSYYIYTLAGDTANSGNSTDNISASAALLNSPSGTCFDSAGNIYIGDTGNKCVRRIDAITGLITTVANSIDNIVDVKIDATGSLYILTFTKLYRCTVATANTFNTPVIIAGNGSSFLNGGYAISSTLASSNGRTINLPNARSMCIDKYGNIYISSSFGITQMISNNVSSAYSATLTAYQTSMSSANNALYGNASITQISAPSPPTSGSYYNDYIAQADLYGYSSTNVPATNGNAQPESLEYIKNYDYSQIAPAQTKLSKLQTLSTIFSLHKSAWNNILQTLNSSIIDSSRNTTDYYRPALLFPNSSNSNAINNILNQQDINRNLLDYISSTDPLYTSIASYQSTMNAYKSKINYNNIETYGSIFTDTFFDSTQTPKNLHDIILASNDSFSTKRKYQCRPFSYTNWGYVRVIGFNTYPIVSAWNPSVFLTPPSLTIPPNCIYVLNNQYNEDFFVDSSKIQDYFMPQYTYYVAITNNDTILNGVVSDLSSYLTNLTIQSDINSARDIAQNAYNQALTKYYGSTTITETPTTGSLFRYNKRMIERYGQNTYTPNPTSGTLFIYNRDYNTLQTATSQLNSLSSSVSPTSDQISTAEAQAIGYIVKIDIYGIIRLYAGGTREPTAITIDSTGNLYVVEHYANKIYKLGANFGGWPPIWDQTPIIDTGSNKPYGIALDNNNNLWISYNANDVSFSTLHAQANKILNYSYNSSSNTYTLINANQIGTGNAATSPYINYYGNNNNIYPNNPTLKNPGLLSIDKNNRLMFTQTGLHSVLLVPLNAPSTTINNIASIRIEQASPGRRVCLKGFSINNNNFSYYSPILTTNANLVGINYSSNTYNSSTSYLIGDIVTYNNILWRRTYMPNMSGISPDNTMFNANPWSLNNISTYTSNEPYAIGKIVIYNGSDVYRRTGRPNISGIWPTDTNAWTMLSYSSYNPSTLYLIGDIINYRNSLWERIDMPNMSGINPSDTFSNPWTVYIYLSNINDINPFINFSFSTPISINKLTLTAYSNDIDAVGMKVLLFDSTGTLVSNRVTTASILTTVTAVDGYTIYYDTTTPSNS